MYEANELEWISEEEFENWAARGGKAQDQSNVKEFVYGKDPYAEPIDYMKAVRDMCR